MLGGSGGRTLRPFTEVVEVWRTETEAIPDEQLCSPGVLELVSSSSGVGQSVATGERAESKGHGESGGEMKELLGNGLSFLGASLSTAGHYIASTYHSITGHPTWLSPLQSSL